MPNSNEAEVTLIGTGGYGECAVIHLGNNKWAIIDSCISPETKKVVSLDYLETINVDFSAVELVICTHWHDDHILGLSQVIEKCENASFYMAGAHDSTNFLSLLSFDASKIKQGPNNSATCEFNKCIDILKNRNSNGKVSLKRVYENTLIYRNPINNVQVFSLSPSHKTMANFDQEILSLIENFISNNTRIPYTSPNLKSIVLFIHFGPHRALLGGDMEVGNDSDAGWLNIINNTTAVDKKATLYKIPHHGSDNGYHPDIWNNLLENDNVIAKLTPYNRGYGLPNQEMIQKYKSHTNQLYITKNSITTNSKKRSKSITKMITEIGLDISEIKYLKGIIQCRIDMGDINAKWNVNLYENAIQL